MSGLPRDIIKWLQSLDLTWQIKNPKWDFSNGYLIAEIFSWYFPHDIRMFAFNTGDSLDLKKRNWYILKNFILKNQIPLNMEDVDGTIFCKEGAAVSLIESLYEYLTSKNIKKVGSEIEMDYTDYAYQMRLPMHQRSTLSKALKNNLRLPEILADNNITRASQVPNGFGDRTVLKSQKIVNDHLEHRRDERRADPRRFGIKPTLGDKCVRRTGPRKKSMYAEPSYLSNSTENSSEMPSAGKSFTEPLTREPSVHFKEVKVRQTNKSKWHQQPVHSY